MCSSRVHEVVVITGASAGVGRATAVAFARRGARIGLLSRGQAGLQGAKQDVEGAGGQALVLPIDVSEWKQVEAAAEAVEREFGPIDVWVNDAMCSVFSPVKQMTAEDYRRVTEVTYLGYVHGTLSALKRMLPRDRGSIVQVGSALAYRGIPLQSAYCAAKHAIRGFHDSLRAELLHDGSRVRVTMVQMPALNTPQFNWVKSRLPRKPQPVPPIYQPEVAAEAIVWAAHHDRREWHVGSSTEVVIAGNKVAPGLGDWYLSRHGFDSQQYDGHDDPHRKNNLNDAVDAEVDFGAHGDFDERAHAECIQARLDRRRDWLAYAALGGACCGALLKDFRKACWGGAIGLCAGALGALIAGNRTPGGARKPPHSTTRPGTARALREDRARAT